jgi:eukaryotic-like serine/threonine-protein kinase
MVDTPSPRKLAGRYEVREILGQGGMGLVYQAYDTVVRREVAVKTILDIPDPTSLQLFYKECDVLASMSHPNIVEIFDIGEFEEDGKKKPYFVMPLLQGKTLDYFVRKAAHRLTMERTIEILTQTCRGLQAAHERGLVHRDLKPSNIFVMEDDSVKIIDFGVAHMADAHTTRAQKGTLLYMSPEQIQLKPLTPASDIFSLSVVCYEALTGRHPFQRSRADEVVDAILHQVPPLASEMNSSVTQAISRVVHKGMAKQSWHRFASAREFGDTLGKAMRNEPIEFFDPERTRPRLLRATKALEAGDFQFAGEILGELEAEGHMDTAIGALRRQLDAGVRRKTLTQLLDAAKARFEEEEDPLALQKLQEALQIEPDNATALALKSKIEKRRSERQIDNWYRLAKQHIDNLAYAHAREALQNVLQLRPDETRALQLIGEIDRQEQDYKKLRQEKEQVHRAALEAWHKGDVSAALAKLSVVLDLDRKAPDSMNRESGTNYQGFYNEVRSEHDAMNAAYAEAKNQLNERNFAKAVSLCQSYLTKYPNNAIFQALRYDIEEQQRQELSAFIASIDRQVEAEPDLEKRVSMLREALERHPGESHFERSLRLIQDKRDLVNSIVARAHLHEEQGAFADALNDWEILRTIYSQYPGLTFEVERLQRRRDQQVRIESKTKLIEQIDGCLHASDYAQALDLLKSGTGEFENDDELHELEKRAEDGVRRKAEAQRLMSEGQELCTQQKIPEGIQLLRQAFELDENNPFTRAVLANALVEQARGMVDSDWQEAEKLGKEASELNPSHPMTKTLRTLILDQKRETNISECVSQARKLQASGELEAALSRISEGLSTYPRDARLVQIQDSVQKDVQVQRRQTKRRDLDELRRLESEADSASDAMKHTIAERARTLATKYAEDQEVVSSANNLLQRLSLPGVASSGKGSKPVIPEGATLSVVIPSIEAAPLKPISQAAAPASATAQQKFGLPVAPISGVKPAATSASQSGKPAAKAPAAKTKPQPAKKTEASAGGGANKRNEKYILIATAAVVVLAAIYLVAHMIGGHKPAPVQQAEVAAPIPVSAPIPVPPVSSLPALRLSTDTSTGKVTFDDQPAAALQDAQWTADKLTAGNHTLKFESPQGSASLNFSADSGGAPVIKGPVTANGVLAVMVSSMGDRVHVSSSASGTKISFDGLPPVEVPQSGLDFPGVAAGPHGLTVSHGIDQYKLDIDVGASPTLTAFVESGQNVGTLLVVAGQDKAKVSINGKDLAELTRNGQLRIANLEPKDYTVRVVKDGFQDSATQKIRVRKGEQVRAVFDLQPVLHAAKLAIQDGTPGTTVLVDKVEVGTIQPDGTLTIASVGPGEHTIELHRDRFRPKQLKKQFAAGQTVTLAAADLAMDAAPGELRIAFTPADAQVTLGRAGETANKISSGSSLNLPTGSYTLIARTADSFTRTTTVEVTGGQSKALDLALAPSGMAKWDNPANWRQENGTYLRKGGNFALYNVSPTSGTFVFSAMLTKGKRLQWVVNYIDDKNYTLFQLDDNNFYRTTYHDGQKGDEAKTPRKSEKKTYRSLEVRVQANEITNLIRQGDSWAVLDRWTQPGTNFTSGKFGFYLPGNDEITLANFGYYLDLNIH